VSNLPDTRVERLERGDSAQAAILETRVRALKERFADRVLPITIRVAERWGGLAATHPVPVVDGLLAATAPGTREQGADVDSRPSPRPR
jgi:hypothetical protein